MSFLSQAGHSSFAMGWILFLMALFDLPATYSGSAIAIILSIIFFIFDYINKKNAIKKGGTK